MRPLSLYKFRVLDKTSHKEILKSNLLSFPSPDKFNDPFDCAIPIHYDQGNKQEITRYWEEHFKISRPDLNRKERKKAAIEAYNGIRQRGERTVRIQEGLLSDVIGIFSLSGNYKSILLWSHYADSHKGFCVGFNVRKLINFCGRRYVELQELISLEEVSYREKYPFINAYEMSKNERLKGQVLTKSPEWRYEREYRLIWFRGGNKKLNIDDGIIKRVILGCKMTQVGKDEIISILKTRKDRVYLYQAKQKQGSFGLDFQLIQHQ
jgi:hypothetical protein